MQASAKPIPTTKNLPCGICGDTSGDCRKIDDGWLCHGDVDGLSTIPGYTHKGQSRGAAAGVWGIWKESQDYTPEEKRQWVERRRQAEEKRLAECLPPIVRDRQYRQLLTELPLDDVDLENLLRRGFTVEEAFNHGYRTIEKWQKLDGDYLPNLPGLSQYGNSLNNCEAGYLCPARNEEGLITGLQYRRRDSAEGGRYRWLSSAKGISVNLPNNEQPLAVFGADSKLMGFAEGIGPKPHFLHLREGINVIGAAGRNWASSARSLRSALATIRPKDCILYPDAGADSHTIEQYRRLYELLKRWGWVMQVAWWGQRLKAIGDVDEITAEERQAIVLISWQDYLREMAKDISEIEVEWDEEAIAS